MSYGDCSSKKPLGSMEPRGKLNVSQCYDQESDFETLVYGDDRLLLQVGDESIEEFLLFGTQ